MTGRQSMAATINTNNTPKLAPLLLAGGKDGALSCIFANFVSLMHHEFRNTGIPTERHATVVQNAGRADQKSVKPTISQFR